MCDQRDRTLNVTPTPDRQKLQTASECTFCHCVRDGKAYITTRVSGPCNLKPSPVPCYCVNKLYLRKFALRKRGTSQLGTAHCGRAGQRGPSGTMTTSASDMITFWPKIGNYKEPCSDNGMVWVGGPGGRAELAFIVRVRNWVATIYATAGLEVGNGRL